MSRELRGVFRNPPSTSRDQTFTEEYLSTSRILRTFADNAPKLTCLALYDLRRPIFVLSLIYSHHPVSGTPRCCWPTD